MRVLRAVQERDRMEERVMELRMALQKDGWPGLEGGLVDAEGFPLFGMDEAAEIKSLRREYRGMLLLCASSLYDA